MKAALYKGPHTIELGERPNPVIVEPTDAIVRVVFGCVCGSDLWYYRGINPHKVGSIGHELIGIVEEVGSGIQNLKNGDLVIAPFDYSDGTCANCRAGYTFECPHGGAFGNGDTDGGQGEYVRAPFADFNLVKVPAGKYSEDMLASLLSLSDVMCTGYHAATSAGVKAGDTVAVVGDGAVGLCGIIASKLKGAERIIALSRNPERQKIAKEFGATDIVPERGEEAIAAVLRLTDGVGVTPRLSVSAPKKHWRLRRVSPARAAWSVRSVCQPTALLNTPKCFSGATSASRAALLRHAPTFPSCLKRCWMAVSILDACLTSARISIMSPRPT